MAKRTHLEVELKKDKTMSSPTNQKYVMFPQEDGSMKIGENKEGGRMFSLGWQETNEILQRLGLFGFPPNVQGEATTGNTQQRAI